MALNTGRLRDSRNVTPDADDARLIGESLANPGQFAGIFDRHSATLLGYLTRRVGQSSADDLLGELFRIAFESPHRYDLTRPNARPWLYGIAANLFLKHFRSISHRDRSVAPQPGSTTAP